MSLTLVLTVLMMLGMPAAIRAAGLSPAMGGALIGGTVDSTGPVVAAAAMLGPEALEVASLVKMIQNVLIGIVAFVFAALWATGVDGSSGQATYLEIWRRLPKFILGFVFASAVFSFILIPGMGDEAGGGNPPDNRPLAGLALLHGLRVDRPSIPPARTRDNGTGRTAGSPLRGQPGRQRPPDPAGRLAVLRRWPAPSGRLMMRAAGHRGVAVEPHPLIIRPAGRVSPCGVPAWGPDHRWRGTPESAQATVTSQGVLERMASCTRPARADTSIER